MNDFNTNRTNGATPRATLNGYPDTAHEASSVAPDRFAVSLFNSRADNTPRRQDYTLNELCALLTTHTTRDAKDGAAWSPATFEGKRSKANAREVCTLVLDYDDGADPLDVTRELDEQGVYYIVHSSHSHTTETPKYRLILPLANPVAAADWPQFYERAAAHFGRGQTDEKCRDASRLYYLPACPPEREVEAFSFSFPGELLDPDDVPDATPTTASQHGHASTRAQTPQSATTPGTMRPYVRAAFEREVATVSHAVNGNRNHTLNRAGFNLFQIVASGELDAGQVERALLDAAARIGLPDAEARRTLQSAREAGLRQPRQLPEPKAPASERTASSTRSTLNASDNERRDDGATTAETSAEARGPYPLNEIGNGQRFADATRGRFLYDYSSNRWRSHEASVWRYGDGDDVERAAKRVEQQVCAEARAEADDDRRAKLYKHAATLTKRKTRETMLKDAASEEGMSAPPEAFDAQLHLLNLQNGTLDLHSFELRPHNPRDLLTKCAGTYFDPKATCPTWTRALRMYLPNEETRNYLQECAGLSISGEVRDEFFNFLFGGGDNGKSVVRKVLERIAGDYHHHAQAETFMRGREIRDGEAPCPSRLALKGARLVTVAELEREHRLNAPLIKDMTGRDPITAREPFAKRPQTFYPQFTLWMIGNEKPIIKDASHGMWRRVRLIPFEVEIPVGERDPDFANKLTAELPGILNWALEGLRRTYEHGLIVPDEVQAATHEYRAEQDAVTAFLDEFCEVRPDIYTPAKDLWSAYSSFRNDRGEAPEKQQQFGAALKLKRLSSERLYVHGRQIRVWRGVGLKTNQK